MLFDWFTLIAQMINFLVLIWLLKRYLYKPILDTIDERENLIASQLNEAEASKANSKNELESYLQQKLAFEQQHHDLLNNAISEVNAERQKLLEQTRNDIEAIRLQLMESLRNEQQNLGNEIMLQTRNEIFTIVRRTLNDLAAVNLEDQVSSVFINRIKMLKQDEKDVLYKAFKNNAGEICVQSMFDLSANQQSAIQTAINENLKIITELKFKTLPSLVSGIELIGEGFKVSWTIEEYLGSLETRIAELLNQKRELSENVF